MQRAKIHSLSLFQSETLSRNEIIKQEIIIFFRNNLVSSKLKNKRKKKTKKRNISMNLTQSSQLNQVKFARNRVCDSKLPRE